MAHKGVPAGAGLNIPDPDGGVQRARHHVHPVKLSNSGLSATSMALDQIKKERCVPLRKQDRVVGGG